MSLDFPVIAAVLALLTVFLHRRLAVAAVWRGPARLGVAIRQG